MTRLEGLIPLEEARRRLLRAATPVRRTEALPLDRAFGRVAAVDLRARRPVPAFARATWDGYAFRASATAEAGRRAPARFRLVGELHAEERLPRPLRRGEAVAVATGAPLPAGADAVEMFEEVTLEDGVVVIDHRVPAGHCLAEPGEDMRRGELLVRAGDVLTPARLGAVGATGATSLRVFARPTVVLVPNGNELLPPGAPPAPGRVHEFNNITLSALVLSAGGLPLALPPVPDDPSLLEGTLEGALRQADLVVASGGSSVGERDLLPRLFPRLGRLLFHGIRGRPGKPTLAARVGEKLVLGMPGHPTSCLSNGFWLLLPLLRRLAHLPGDGTEKVAARLGEAHRAPSEGFATVLPVRLQGGWAYPTSRGSASITSLTEADGFVILGPRRARHPKGARVTVHRLPAPLAPVRATVA